MSELGILVDPSPAPRPQPAVLAGRVVTLQPFDLPAQAESLYPATHGPQKEDLWRYMGDGPSCSQVVFEAALHNTQQCTLPLFFSTLENATGPRVRQASALRI